MTLITAGSEHTQPAVVRELVPRPDPLRVCHTAVAKQIFLYSGVPISLTCEVWGRYEEEETLLRWFQYQLSKSPNLPATDIKILQWLLNTGAQCSVFISVIIKGRHLKKYMDLTYFIQWKTNWYFCFILLWEGCLKCHQVWLKGAWCSRGQSDFRNGLF